MRRRKGEPADKESDRIVRRFRYGIQKRNILCPERFDIVQEASEKKNEEGEEEWKGEIIKGQNEADKAEDYSVQKERCFFDFALHKWPVALGRVMYIKRSVGYFVDDVIGC